MRGVRIILAAAAAAIAAACNPAQEPPVAEPPAPAAAPAETLESVLGACFDASKAVTDADPTTFACDWAAVGRLRSPGAANLTGAYAPESPGIVGALTVVEKTDGTARVALSTAAEPSLHTCTFAMEGKRIEGNRLEVTSPDESSCIVRVDVASDGVVLSGEGDCAYYCGARAGFTGAYVSKSP